MPFQDDDRDYPKRGQDGIGGTFTIASLQLDIDAAARGKTWLLLPAGFRDADAAKRYPLPTSFEEIHKIAILPLRPRAQDGGTVYMKRVGEEYRKRLSAKQSALLDIGRDKVRIAERMRKHGRTVQRAREEINALVADVAQEAGRAIATLNDLLILGRKGMEGQMRAHLEGKDWQGEPIDSAAFRNCFRLVTQAVKSLNVPAGDETAQARDAVMAQAAEALKASQDAVELADAPAIPSPPDPTTEH